jgi:hypothetical protein
MRSPRRLRLGSTVVALLALALVAGPAEASASTCAPAPVTNPFLPWHDVADYIAAPGGDLESAGAWDLRGGAAVVAGNEPFHVGAADDSSSLKLPAGGSATTAPMCVGIEHTTMRFFAKRESGSQFSLLRVEAVVEGRFLPIGFVTGSGRWEPTPPVPILVNALALLHGSTQVAFRFTPLSGSQWSIDDVYVDPYRTN